MHNIATITELTKKHISSIGLASLCPKELYAPIEYSLSVGGKRIRPVLVLLSCNLFSDNIQPAIPAALAIEVFHNFTLLHDDIMDKADMRRNQQTVHKKWDENIAILSGDAMSILSFSLLADLDSHLLKPIFKLFNTTALQVCEGQQFDMNFQDKNTVTLDEYLEMIRLKTSVLLACSAKAGALAGGANEMDADAMYEFGLSLGLAFQIQDDLLDSFGNEAVFGKKIGGDIVENKKTFLMISALNKADDAQRNKIFDLNKNKEIENNEKINQILAIYNELKVKEMAEEKIRELYEKAIKALDSIKISLTRKNELYYFAANLMKRNN